MSARSRSDNFWLTSGAYTELSPTSDHVSVEAGTSSTLQSTLRSSRPRNSPQSMDTATELVAQPTTMVGGVWKRDNGLSDANKKADMVRSSLMGSLSSDGNQSPIPVDSSGGGGNVGTGVAVGSGTSVGKGVGAVELQAIDRISKVITTPDATAQFSRKVRNTRNPLVALDTGSLSQLPRPNGEPDKGA